MIHFTSSLEEEFNRSSKGIISTEANTLVKMQELCSLLENVFDRLRVFIREYSFKDEAEEILFFKTIKPKLFCHLIFYRKVYDLEMSRPTGGECIQKEYLKNELGYIKYYFDTNRAFYNYYRSGDSSMDMHYFLRKRSDAYLCQESFYFERDPMFSTYCDFKMAKVIANEMVEKYILEELRKLEEVPMQSLKSGLVWTASKVDLCEMLLACYLVACYNGGRINQNELKSRFEMLFNIDLGNLTRTFYDLGQRTNPTQFIDKLKKAIEDYFKKKLD